MNISKFTQKSVEAVQNCEKLAYEYGNQQIDQEHLLVSLLKLDDSLILKLITKMGISGEQFADEAEAALKKLPKVSGGGQVYLTQDLNKVLIKGDGRRICFRRAFVLMPVKTAEQGYEGTVPYLWDRPE